MSFASLTFLFLFLPSFLAVYYGALAARSSIRVVNGIALAFSLFFYTWGAPQFVPLLLFSCGFDYFISLRLAAADQNETMRRRLLTLSIAANVGCLLYFKYVNFFVLQTNELLSHLGRSGLDWTPIVLPIGISFITFEKLSYIVDVYRGRTAPARSLVTYLLFIALFPHLIAGPIFRYHDLASQLLNREHRRDKAAAGALRFMFGLAKKVLIADALAPIADSVFALPVSELTAARAWIGILAYTFQIYFDFSGYSDMAIGLGRLFGFEFIENFNHPYISQSITDFWRRWHISLSNWLREYLYIPLGGNRLTPLRTYLNLWIVFLISGFWHGANWTFVAWGCYHGLFLMADRLFLLRWLELLPVALRTSITFVFVLCGWVLFRADSLPHAMQYLASMFIPTSTEPTPHFPLLYQLNFRAYTAFGFAAALSFLPLVSGRISRIRIVLPDRLRFATWGATAIALFLLSIASLVSSNFHPFIYFRF